MKIAGVTLTKCTRFFAQVVEECMHIYIVVLEVAGEVFFFFLTNKSLNEFSSSYHHELEHCP